MIRATACAGDSVAGSVNTRIAVDPWIAHHDIPCTISIAGLSEISSGADS
jgi:hypothetical protein